MTNSSSAASASRALGSDTLCGLAIPAVLLCGQLPFDENALLLNAPNEYQRLG